MLVLARKVGQSIVVNDNVVVTIKDINKDIVRIAVEAPRDVHIYRKELVDNVVDSNKAAVVSLDRSSMKSLLHKAKEQRE